MTRERWFRQYTRAIPWAVYPIHWKGWAIQILGPVALLMFANFAPTSPAVLWLVIVCGVGALMLAIYTHTEIP